MLRIQRIGFALIATFVFAGLARAQSPHFNSASARRQGNNLDVSFKESGLGREGGHEGIEEYTEVKSVVINLA